MSDQHVEGTVPAAGDPEPGAVTPAGDASTQFDTQPGEAQAVAAEAEKNARLRAELAAANAALEEALAASRSALEGVPGTGGLSDEDVRRLEAPHEFHDSMQGLHDRVVAIEEHLGIGASKEAAAV